MSLTATEVGKRDGSWRSVRSPLEREMTLTRPVDNMRNCRLEENDSRLTFGHRVSHPMSGPNGGARQERRVNLDERNRGRLHCIRRRTNLVKWLRDIEDDGLLRAKHGATLAQSSNEEI